MVVMKDWIKYLIIIILAFIIGLAIGYISILINPEFRVNISPLLDQILSQRIYIIIAIIVIVIIVMAALVSKKKLKQETKKESREK
jgi:NADH:ubiquinone oxidoreductase subunit 3 (subunit A)